MICKRDILLFPSLPYCRLRLLVSILFRPFRFLFQIKLPCPSSFYFRFLLWLALLFFFPPLYFFQSLSNFSCTGWIFFFLFVVTPGSKGLFFLIPTDIQFFSFFSPHPFWSLYTGRRFFSFPLLLPRNLTRFLFFNRSNSVLGVSPSPPFF